MADDVPVNPENAEQKKGDGEETDEAASGKIITVTVKTPKEKETVQVSEDMSIREVSVYIHITKLWN